MKVIPDAPMKKKKETALERVKMLANKLRTVGEGRRQTSMPIAFPPYSFSKHLLKCLLYARP